MRREWDKYHLLNVFYQVVEKGSFSKAAVHLNLPNSSVSKAVSQLESHLGKTLLLRTTRALSVTDEGAIVYKRAQALLEGFRSLEEELEELDSTPKGKLRITFPNTLGRMLFSQICNDFLKAYPDFELELIFTASNLDLIEENIDIAFRTWKTLPNSSLYSMSLLKIKLLFVASPDYLARCGTPVSLECLAHHNVLVTRHSTLENAWSQDDGTQHTFSGNLIANNRFHIREAVLAGVGVGMLPSYFCQKDINSGGFVELLPELKRGQKTLGAIYRIKRDSSKKLDTFLSFVEQRLALLEL
ncbi:LysR family transcriptional regulator [Pseudoalteromonas aurantia]|uniref:LysR family transcriptional regulator n=1 Tax=Pseudoalteromonas aurantia TaxID=43654 RepID=A0A5S3V711_9GAMM|nr:LysR family transcriptional regulator [Pseudoalteromonas aurantia]TMO67542.1 LysR family transcriptional regulator [Pseudoalteromonas aurantia]TMO73315.1 LysR family transcriptional regulator [Pseudoalteromonas aurantia]